MFCGSGKRVSKFEKKKRIWIEKLAKNVEKLQKITKNEEKLSKNFEKLPTSVKYFFSDDFFFVSGQKWVPR